MLADVRVEDSTGRILSHGTSKLLVTQGLQPISQIAELAGTSLPPVSVNFRGSMPVNNGKEILTTICRNRVTNY